MTKIYITIILFYSLVGSRLICAHDEVERKGWNVAVGLAALGGCDKDYIYKDNGDLIDSERFCFALPVLDFSFGYGISRQVQINLQTKSLFLAGLIGIEGQYYFHDEAETGYIYAGAMKAYALGYGTSPEVVGSLGIGYAKNHAEYEIGIVGKDIITMSVKYVF